MKRYDFGVLLASIILPIPLHASIPATTLWDESVAKLMQLAEEARNLQLTGFQNVESGQLIDTAELETKLSEVSVQLKKIQSPPPGLGAFFEDGERGTVINSLLIDGPLSRAGARVGDAITQVNGQAVANYSQIPGLTKQDANIIMVKGRSSPLIVRPESPQLFSVKKIRSVTAEFESIEQQLARFKRDLQMPTSDPRRLSKESQDLLARMNHIKEEITQMWIQAANEKYRNI